MDSAFNESQETVRLRNEKLETMRPYAPVLARWLFVLFWNVFPATLASILSNQTIVAHWPELQGPAQLLSLICTVVTIVALWKLSPVNRGYRIAFWCTVVCCVGTVLMGLALLTNLNVLLVLSLMLGIPAAVVGMVGTYQQYKTHAEVLDCIDDHLAATWRTLWKWYIGLLLGMFACVVVVFFSAILALILIVLFCIAMLGVCVIQMITLYHSAQLFRDYPTPTALPEAPENPTEEMK